MRLKLGASIEGCTWRAFHIAICADKVWQKFGFTDATITSGTDGKHGPNTKHYGDALDLRIWHLSKAAVMMFAAELRKELGPDYDVVVEDDHIHAEYDPKGES